MLLDASVASNGQFNRFSCGQCFDRGHNRLRIFGDFSFREIVDQKQKHYVYCQNAGYKERENPANWISGVSHDIRTPLSMIMGYAQRIAGDHGASGNIQQEAGFDRSHNRLRIFGDFSFREIVDQKQKHDVYCQNKKGCKS